MKKVLALMLCALMICSALLPLSALDINGTATYDVDNALNVSVADAAVESDLEVENGAVYAAASVQISDEPSVASVQADHAAISAMSEAPTALLTCSVEDKPDGYHRGDTVEVYVSLSECEIIKAIGLKHLFDENVFEIISCDWEGAMTSALLKSALVNGSVATMSKDTHVEGKIYKFVLKVKDNADFGETDVDIIITRFKTNDDEIEYTNIPAKVNVTCVHAWNVTDTVAPTCVSSGTKTYYCPICESTVVETLSVDPDAHNWEFAGSVDYTCTEDGYSVYECTLCGKTKKDDFVPAAHRYEKALFEASPTSKRGFTLHTCTVCGDSYKDDFTFYVENTRAKAYVETVYGSAGETVEVSVIVEDAEDLKVLSIKNLEYDESKLELVKAEWKLKGIMSDWNETNKTGVLAFESNTHVGGAVFTFTFKLNNDLLDYETQVSCELTARTKPEGGIETEVEIDNYSGKVWVAVHGDVSGDNAIDSDDAIYLLNHVADPDNYDYELNQLGDYNGDGYVDSDDAIYLLYHTLLPSRYPLK